MAKVKINWPPMSMKAEGEDAAVLAQAEQFLKYVKEAHKISFDVLPTIFRDGCRDPEELDDEDDEDVEPLTEPEEVAPGAQWDVVAILRFLREASLARRTSTSCSRAERCRAKRTFPKWKPL